MRRRFVRWANERDIIRCPTNLALGHGNYPKRIGLIETPLLFSCTFDSFFNCWHQQAHGEHQNENRPQAELPPAELRFVGHVSESHLHSICKIHTIADRSQIKTKHTINATTILTARVSRSKKRIVASCCARFRYRAVATSFSSLPKERGGS